ncbi:TPA: ead/Ea22-like family protein [Salmonella enterica]|uniref:ead/Ea22-like family protein n=1 Tax=Salmonella enterica TaxID=28901 RepID=UPI00098E6A72|nr:ead/Ea22-like family protein [Salmonella enterica]EAY2109389.1 ead/Ea22-like family protein [Salmonella enterica subsp. enterica serovar Typhimurium]EBF9822698.1 ead/Ea22-like family protein [Salmonella enterica subsp. enterica serovar Heidelberg]EEE3935592.1 ead/Ea22-like family protein [Salmonella enterica subsp. enterica serovar Infantis]EAB5938169.1 ead/Ea22-like family protein [Salmonella enterica subsp. enterica serovar Minnesota]EAB8446417.1 ead/Ea22-like family protein [Salmonella e
MSNIDKQALREEFRYMQEHYSDPADRARQVIYIAAEALLDELEHYKSREERVTKLVLDNSTSWDALYEKLEAAEKRIAEQREYYEGVIADGSKRIAELEAKLANPVSLPKTNGYWNEQEKAYEEAITLARRQIRLAGFRCEGDE